MIDTVRKHIGLGITNYINQSTNRIEWVMNHHAQVVSVGSQISWCLSTESAILDQEENAKIMFDWLDLNV